MAIEQTEDTLNPSPKAALVVGASQGIGLGFVRHLLNDASVSQLYATYRSPNSAQGLLTLEPHHTHLHCLALDITDEAQMAQMVAKISTMTPHLHLVVNCVGILHEGNLQPEKSLRQLDRDRLLRYFEVNSIGAVLLAKHLLPLLSHSDRNMLATISAKIGSIGDNHLGGWYGYRASKAALNMFMRTAAIEYRRKRAKTIIVNLHPGTTDTRLSQPFQRSVPPEKLFSCDRTVSQLIAVMDGLTEEQSGEFFSWDGSQLPW
jgi:NAD(P)-dependent dehydrogenase (short-subunit alcohol dehydrogenase family)